MSSATTENKESFWHFAIWCTALFLTALGAQLWIVWIYGSPIPVWDQWSQALSVFRPWLQGNLHWSELFAPDSNHRIVVTHLFDLAVIGLNGHWDPLLQMTLNAFLRAAFVVGLAYCFWNFFGRRNAWLVVFLLLPFFALPYAGENAIWGINSVWYFADIFALAAIAGLGFERIRGWKWWLGLAAAILGLLTISSGLIAPVTAGGIVFLRAIKNRQFGKNLWPTLSMCGLLALLGLRLIAWGGENHQWQAHSFSEFTWALTHNLSWPFFNLPEMVFVIAAPLILLLVFYLRPDFSEPRAAELVLGLGLWSALQSALIAFGRANYVASFTGSRYMDVFNLFVIASLFAVVLLADYKKIFSHWNEMLLPLIYFMVILSGLWRISSTVVDDVLVPTREWNLIAEERVEAYFKTGNEQEFFQPPTIQPDPKAALEVLRDPDLQKILPPICLPPDSSVAPGHLSGAAQWFLKNSIAILFCGLILFVGLCCYNLVRQPANAIFPKSIGIIVLLAGLAATGFVWSKHSLQRASAEREFQQQIANYFSAMHRPDRAATHRRKADEANSTGQFAN